MLRSKQAFEKSKNLLHFFHYFFNLILMKSNLSLYSLQHAKVCNKIAGPVSASLRPGNIASFKEMSQQRQAVGNTASNLTGPRFEL